jgi:hypothetical protein
MRQPCFLLICITCGELICLFFEWKLFSYPELRLYVSAIKFRLREEGYDKYYPSERNVLFLKILPEQFLYFATCPPLLLGEEKAVGNHLPCKDGKFEKKIQTFGE